MLGFRPLIGRRCALLLLSSTIPSSPSFATPYDLINAAAAKAVIAPEKIRPNVFVLEGSGGNITVLEGADGLLLVDSGIALSRKQLEKALSGIGNGRLRYVVNTHWHWDHTDGNGWMHAKGAVVIAHPNAIKHLASTIRVQEWGHTFTPIPAKDRPTQAVSGTRIVAIDGDQAHIQAYPPGHTDGDLFVYFQKADVLATGDTFWNRQYPFIDYVAGGGINGMIRATDVSLSIAKPNTRIVPGHGPVASRADLLAYRNMLVDVRNRIRTMKAAGKSLKQVIEAKPSAAYDAIWGKTLITPELFDTLVYRGV